MGGTHVLYWVLPAGALKHTLISNTAFIYYVLTGRL